MQNKARFVIYFLIVIITGITLLLGCLMYNSNLKNTEQNVISVELADFIYNINYSMQFGKKIETFYGMEKQLDIIKENFENIQDLYVLSSDSQILFSTEKVMPEHKICMMLGGDNKIQNESLYCMYQMNEESKILVKTSTEQMHIKMKTYILQICKTALIGIVAVAFLNALLGHIVKNEKNVFKVSFILLILWTFLFGSMIGYDGYRVYGNSLDTVFQAVQNSVNADFNQIKALGISEQQIHGVEQYLSRYAERIPEIEQVQMENGEIICIRSEDYSRKVLLDYGLQTVLLLTFSILILTEYHLLSFHQKNYQEEGEVQNGNN